MTLNLLLIDDNEIDAEFTRRTIAKHATDIRLDHVHDGVDGLRYLRAEKEFGDRPPVDLVLLDLHMPRMDGQTFLSELRSDRSLSQTVVVVLLASEDMRDATKRFGVKIDAYLVKPIESQNLKAVLHSLGMSQD
tara:strand:- start:817629 stop:818030 length:402 start_codon:yes stop_codon:yes gene_type:complete